jgi:capsular polysaccharide biosynthesis protein
MQGSGNLTEDIDIDLKGLLAAAWRKKIAILILSVTAGALLYMFLSTIPARYRSDAQVLIPKQGSVYTRIPNLENSGDRDRVDERAIQSQGLIMASDDLAIRVIKELGLEKHPEFNGASTDPSLVAMARNFLEPGQDAPASAASARLEFVDPGILAKFKEQVTVYSPENSRVVVIDFWSTDRALAMKVPNTLANEYLKFTQSMRLKAEAARAGETKVQLRALEREAAAQRQRLETYLGSYYEASSRQASGFAPSEARIIEHAVVPSESFFPKTKAFTVAGMAATALLSIIGVLLAELLSGRALKPVGYNSHEQMQEMMPERLDVGAAPSLAPSNDEFLRDTEPSMAAPETHHVVLPETVFGSQLEDLRPSDGFSKMEKAPADDRDIFRMDYALQAIEALGSGLIAVVTLDTHHGGLAVTRMTIQIARYLANAGYSTVMADITSEGKTARTILGRGDAPGLCDVLAGELTLRDVLLEDQRSSLHIVGTGKLCANTKFTDLPAFIDALGHSYDFVILACGSPSLGGLAKVAKPETIIVVPILQDESAAESEEFFGIVREAGYAEAIMVSEMNGVATRSSAA